MTNNSESMTAVPMRKTWIGLALAIVSTIILYGVYLFVMLDDKPDIFGHLEENGYVANTGFSGIYTPGNTIQIMEQDSNGQEHKLKSPIIFLWAKDCFPGKMPQKNAFVLPESSGHTTTTLNIGADAIVKLLPTLQFDNKTVIDYEMRLEKPQVYTYSKADLSHHYTEKCRQAFANSLDGGDKIEWYAVINEAIVAESLRFEVKWKSGTSINARNKLKENYKQSLSTMLGLKNIDQPMPNVVVDFETDTEKKTIFRATGPVILGYRSRPIYVVE